MLRRPTCQVGRRHRGGIFAAVVVTLAVVASPAQAAFHEILVREVYAGGAANDSYVVLQAYSGGQNFVSGHSVTAYDAAGGQVGSFAFTGKVDNGSNQMTILVADTAYSATFEDGPAPDGSTATLNLSPAGGAVCWTGLDCASWGDFKGTTSPPSNPPALPAGIPASMALQRSIAPNCATLLEAADDSGSSSAADFFAATPNPRSNASPIAEKICVAPTATIETAPLALTKATSASFTYSSSPPGADFECRLDAAAFGKCEAGGIEYSALADGKHAFRVRAKDANGTGAADLHEWTIDTTAPVAEIKTQPKDPSPGNGASFTYASNETGSTFQCSLVAKGDPASYSSCPATGRTYPEKLADGEYTFAVFATDKIGNEGDADTYTWKVDNSLIDETPPQTTIITKPPDPSTSSTASFTYGSNEPGSSFECKLDGGAFAPCVVAGIAYTGLGNGPHSFQVAARDPSGNLDESPAGHSWTVAVATIAPPPPFPPPIPQTTITAKPGAVTRDRTPTFRFRSSVAGASFECKVDRGAFRPCSSPFTTRRLSFGSHTVRVRALAGGSADPSPAKSSFRVAKKRKRRR